MENVIYAYKKIDENKIVYVGQTVNLALRHYRHTKIDPFDEGLKEYNYPLSRGIRKYGVQAYKLIILEQNLKKEELDNREQYWINYYNTYNSGYNQTLGGNTKLAPMITYKEDIILNVIDELKNTNKSFQTIANDNNISLTHVYNINIGARRKIEGISYPIRDAKTKGTKGLKFSQEECKEIHEYILHHPKETLKSIAKKYKCSDWTIRHLNNGDTKAYILNGYTYPLR